MPLWRIFCAEGVYTASEKQSLAKAITEIYTTTSPVNLPAFYVNVIFVESDAENIYVGGDRQQNFVRFAGEHIARYMSPDEEGRMRTFMGWFTKAVAPWTTEKGLRWEAHIGQTPRDLWRVNGLVPPLAESEGESLWRKMNAPVPYENEGTTPSRGGTELNETSVNGVMAAKA